MLRELKSLYGYTLNAIDGDIGRVYEFLFDDTTWTIQFVVVKTGSPFMGRKVLLSPATLDQPEWSSHSIGANLTMEEVRQSPGVETNKPVPRQQLDSLIAYYEMLGFTAGGMLNAAPLFLPLLSQEVEREISESNKGSVPHLRSTREIVGYHIRAVDDVIGHVHDFVLDDEKWRICSLVIATRNWIPGRKVLVSPKWISAIKWRERNVQTKLTKQSIRNSPPFDPTSPINSEYAVRRYDYYGRPIDMAAHVSG